MSMTNLERVTFTSVWDGDIEVTTDGVLYPSGHIECVSSDVDGLENLEREYVTKEDGSEYTVCPDCHEYILEEDGKCKNVSCEHNI